jgi:hypothetical protein
LRIFRVLDESSRIFPIWYSFKLEIARPGLILDIILDITSTIILASNTRLFLNIVFFVNPLLPR